MIALLQRTTSATVHINKQIYNHINQGLVIFLGILACINFKGVILLCLNPDKDTGGSVSLSISKPILTLFLF